MTIEERVECLERQNRRMKRVCLLCLTAIVAGALLCALGLPLNRAHAQGIEAQKVIEASAFRLVDGQGNLRAELTVNPPRDHPAGGPGLFVYGVKGTTSVSLREDGLDLNDWQDTTRVSLWLDGNTGLASLLFLDEHGKKIWSAP
jgi:hypothetical protein